MCYYFENSDFDFSFTSSQEKNSVVLYPIFIQLSGLSLKIPMNFLWNKKEHNRWMHTR